MCSGPHMPKVYFAADHAGFDLKNALMAHVKTLGYEVEDMGAYALDPDDNYPDFVTGLAVKVAESRGEARGIVVGGSGQGEAMAANRIHDARASVFYGGDTALVRLAREHNDANILSLGARFVSPGEAEEAASLFLKTPFSGDPRHVRRLAKF